ncbi:MAG: hypothetical protein SYNGOMJ08_00762 [Candidatus Syntrophoarchaeum sp. GoM_oil]|nr:MAG: hypothetical protein SYNGOMJ08_00762 [Candidatus Syntrophoarchaeum sp. GoM_oil]
MDLRGNATKKSPAIVKEMVKNIPVFKAPSNLIVFKRWDMLEESDDPEIVIFFVRPDPLSGLFTLAGFDTADQNGIFTPFGAGCATSILILR